MSVSRRRLRLALAAVLAALAVCAAGFFWYVSDYYRADAQALAIGQTAKTTGPYTSLSAENAAVGIVFYPGGKVEAAAYLPLLQQLQQQGYTCVLAQMPFHLAVFGSNAATDAMALHPEVQHWYLAGHSLGGAMAGSYAAAHPDKVEGLLLLGAYLYGEYPAEEVLVLYGSEDGVLNRAKLTGQPFEQVIAGGNHAQFGNYGPQAGDGTAAISAAEQQAIAVRRMDEFIRADLAG